MLCASTQHVFNAEAETFRSEELLIGLGLRSLCGTQRTTYLSQKGFIC